MVCNEAPSAELSNSREEKLRFTKWLQVSAKLSCKEFQHQQDQKNSVGLKPQSIMYYIQLMLSCVFVSAALNPSGLFSH